MNGFKSLNWGYLILFSWIVSIASFQPATADTGKYFVQDIQDNHGGQEVYLTNSFFQKHFGNDFRIHLPEKDSGRNVAKSIPFIEPLLHYRGGIRLITSLLRHYALLIPSRNCRTLIYPFHSFM